MAELQMKLKAFDKEQLQQFHLHQNVIISPKNDKIMNIDQLKFFLVFLLYIFSNSIYLITV